jgi:hypothetical protein
MANTAAAVVDRVLPDVPVRQYVLSLPYELRKLAAFKADVLTALGRIFVEAIFAGYRAGARRTGIEDAQCGAVEGRKPKADPMAKRTPGIPGPSACHEPFGT